MSSSSPFIFSFQISFRTNSVDFFCLKNSLDLSYNLCLLSPIILRLHFDREEHDLLVAVQDKLAAHSLTAPVLGNDHHEFRGRGSLVC